MKRKTYRCLMSLFTAGVTALSLLLPGGAVLAVPGGAENIPTFSEQPSPSDAEPAGLDPGEAAQEAAVSNEMLQEKVPGGEAPSGPDADGEAQEEKRPEEGAPEVTNPNLKESASERADSDGDAQKGTDSEKDAQDKADPDGNTPEVTDFDDEVQDGPDSDGNAPEVTDSDGEVQDEPDSDGNNSERTDGEDGTQEEPNSDGEVLKRSALRAAASAERTSSGVTFEKTGDYAYNIYANGQPLLIEVSSDYQYSELYIDENRNGIGDPEEEITEFRGDAADGIYYCDGFGYFLLNTTIYGGAKEGDCQYDTSVTLTGTDSNKHSVFSIVGGNKNGKLTGNTHVNISGGGVQYIYGGGTDDTMYDPYGNSAGKSTTIGSSSIIVSGGKIFYNIWGKGGNDQLTDAALTFQDYGSESDWAEVTFYQPAPGKFDTILMQNSYIRFKDNSTVGNDCTLGGCAEKLIFDGGALWVDDNNMLFGMPPTEFRNNPLLTRTIDSDPIHFDVVPEGTARIQWMDESGTASEGKKESPLVETPEEAPDSIFTAGIQGYALKRSTTERYSYPDHNLIWKGAAWYVMGPVEESCNCQLCKPTLQQQNFQWSGEGSQTVTLEEIHAGNESYSANCEVVGHKGTAIAVEYSMIPEGTTAPGASISGDQLTVGGTGSVCVRITKRLNGKSLEGDCYVQILEVPDSDSFIFVKDKPEDIRFTFSGITAAGNLDNVFLWDTSNGSKFVSKTNYSIESDENTVSFNFAENYLAGLALGEYKFRAQVPYLNGGGKDSSYWYDFTVKVVQVIEVDHPVIEILEGPFYYDGAPKKPSVVVKDGNTVISEEEYEVAYGNNIGNGAASATAYVIITDKPGGRYEVNGTKEFEIVNEYEAKNGTDYLAKLNDKGWTNEDFTISAAEGHLLSTGNALADDWTETLPPRTEETDGGSVTFYVKDKETGLISLAVTENYKLDRTAPEGTDILFDGNSVKAVPEDVAFSGLFGKKIKAEVTAEDALSGIGDISYLQSDKILTQEELERADGWIKGRESEISAEDGKKFVVYGKATDQAGNTVYIASEGGEFDLKAPEIGGIEPDGTYYVTQIANVTDAHLNTVTVNGEAVSKGGKVTLFGNREAAYVIKASDQLGHETVVTVTMKPIASLAEPIKGLTEDNVTSDDAETIQQVLEAAKSVITKNATEEEKEELQALIDTCESFYRKALADYRILEGDGSEWTSGTDGAVTFRANGAFSKFVGILIDGQSVDPEGYMASEGSTVITLKKDLLETLGVGTHSLTVLYSDGGKASAEFEISKNSSTGGENSPGSGGEEPGSGGEEPGPGGEEPGLGRDESRPEGEKPGSGTQAPGSGGKNAGTGTEASGSGNETSGIKAQNMISAQTGDDSLLVLQLIIWMLSGVVAAVACYGISRNKRRN